MLQVIILSDSVGRLRHDLKKLSASVYSANPWIGSLAHTVSYWYQSNKCIIIITNGPEYSFITTLHSTRLPQIEYQITTEA